MNKKHIDPVSNGTNIIFYRTIIYKKSIQGVGFNMSTKYTKLFIFIFLSFFVVSNAGCSYLKEFSLPANNDNAPSKSIPVAASPNIEVPPKEPIINPNETNTTPETPAIKLVEYAGPIRHIFFHSLIAFPEINFSKAIGGSFDTDCITVSEFKRTLEELYKNNYILIDIHSTYEVVKEDGREAVKNKKLFIPEGKKPLVMSVDDMVYDPKKMGQGMVDKIILDEAGNFATYTKHRYGNEVISHDNEIIPILEQFVKEHPDFSFNGAKATLAVTGWVGILGYRIDRKSTNRQSEIDAVKPIIEKLKERGWNFASHGYGHRDAAKVSNNLFADDTKKWRNEIEPVIGPTDIYVYPYGSKVSVNDTKYKLLLEYGFKMICGVGSIPYWNNYGHSVFMDRQSIDGYSLRKYHKYLLPLLDTTKVFDAEARTIR
jgi:hypothetical protein